ncbi:MAG: methyltransferase domain-containing protein [Phycisphaerales bacterium]|nr:methyltransferase domain-containing protein [Phycisphaerales bacterium]
MSQRTMQAHYEPNWKLTQARNLRGYNCGYAAVRGNETFDEHQQSLVWQLLGATPITSDSVVLDVGCGIGGPSGWIFDKYKPARLIGLEYLGTSVRAASRRWNSAASRPRFVQGDAHNLPLESDSVDVIFNLESALHYARKNNFLGECWRILKPGGALCLGDITTTRKLMFAPIEWLNKLPSQFNSNLHLWSAAEYKDAFRTHGFELLHHEDAALHVADALDDGLDEIRGGGFFASWKATKGFRGRVGFLGCMSKMFRRGWLNYDLFRARKPVRASS